MTCRGDDSRAGIFFALVESTLGTEVGQRVFFWASYLFFLLVKHERVATLFCRVAVL